MATMDPTRARLGFGLAILAVLFQPALSDLVGSSLATIGVGLPLVAGGVWYATTGGTE